MVDLWDGTARPGQPWAADTRAVLMSLANGLTAPFVQVLVDFREEVAEPLELDTRIGTHRRSRGRSRTCFRSRWRVCPAQAVQAYGVNQARCVTQARWPARGWWRGYGTMFLDHPNKSVNRAHVLGIEIRRRTGRRPRAGWPGFFAMLAMGGELGDLRMLSAQAVRAFRAVQVRCPDPTNEARRGEAWVARRQ